MIRLPASLRVRLLALLGVAFLPLVALAVFTAVQQWQIALESSRSEVLRIALLAAANQQRVLEGTRELLDTLARSPDVRSPDAARCQRFLQSLSGSHAWYLNLGVIGSDGYLRCRSGPAPRVYLGDRDYFRSALQTADFSVGTVQVGRLTGRKSVVVGRALTSDDAEPIGVLYAALDLNALNRRASETQMPDGATLTIFDRNGVVITRTPDSEKWIGKPAPDRDLVATALLGKPGWFERHARPSHHLVAYAPVDGFSKPEMFVAVEVPERAVVGAVTRALIVFLTGLAVVSAAAMALAWIAGSALVVRPIRAIIDAASTVAGGNLSGRTGLKHGRGELGELAVAFDGMAQSLEQRMHQLLQTDRALEESGRAYRKLFFENPIPMWLYDRDSLRFLEVNTAAQKQYGFTRDQFLAMGIKDIRPPQEIPRLLEDIRNYDELELKVGIWRHLRKDGTEIEVEVSTHDTTWEGARARLVLAYDVTEREHALDALAQLKERYRALIELSPDPIHIHRDGTIVFVNSAALRFFGARTDAELLGRSIFEFALPQYHELIRERWRRMYAGEPVPLSEQHIRTLNGRIADVEVSSAAIVDQGSPSIIVIFRDIGERKRALRALEDSEGRYRQLVETAGEGIWIMDTDSRITFVNARMCEMLGYRAEEMIGERTLTFVDTAWHEPAQHQIELRRQGISSRHELPLRRKDGSQVWALVSASPIMNPDGSYSGGLAMFTDIGDLKAAQQHLERINLELEERVNKRTAQLEASNEELEAFAYSVSHDLRAPIRTIDGFSMALLEDFAPKLDPQAQEYLGRIRSATERMGELIEDLLALSRVARVKLRHEPVNLTKVAQSVADEMARANSARDVRVTIEPDVTAQGDPGLMRILLENLFDNAWKFTRKQLRAEIAFGVEDDSDAPVYFVRDNGVGFDMTYAQKLFGVFQRLHSEREFEGTGIGLATVQRIVRRHGGRVWAEGANGKGATIFFTLE